MRLVLKPTDSRRNSLCLFYWSNLSGRIIRGGKNGSRALSPRHVRRTLVTQTNPAIPPSRGLNLWVYDGANCDSKCAFCGSH